MRKVNILDTTLRDGSYAINFSFTAAQTAALSKELEGAGVHYIEIGHGIGMGATRKGLHPAMESDADYLKAARSAVTTAQFGMFCIPGVADLEDLDVAAEYGMNFIRIGSDVDKVAESESFIRKAKQLGMTVAANYMKSYAIDAKAFAENVKRSEGYGADIAYIVDSAGGMFFESVREFFETTRKVTDIAIGFHGHDNLGLAVSNSLEAARLNFDFVDTSLQGMGRSSGNAATETLVAALTKSGIEHGIDFLKILKLGPKYIQPLWLRKGIMPLDVVAGFAEFHSSYMPQILKASSAFEVDPALLIIEVCKIDKVNLDDKIINRVAQKIHDDHKTGVVGEYGFSTYVGGEEAIRVRR